MAERLGSLDLAPDNQLAPTTTIGLMPPGGWMLATRPLSSRTVFAMRPCGLVDVIVFVNHGQSDSRSSAKWWRSRTSEGDVARMRSASA